MRKILFSRDAVEGPFIAEFEKQFADYHAVRHAVSTSYGRMAFYYILKAFDFPPESEIILPALTFWVIPEIARVAGLRPVFVDINPLTYNLDPDGYLGLTGSYTKGRSEDTGRKIDLWKLSLTGKL